MNQSYLWRGALAPEDREDERNDGSHMDDLDDLYDGGYEQGRADYPNHREYPVPCREWLDGYERAFIDEEALDD